MKLAILLVLAEFSIAACPKNKSISDPYVAFNLLWTTVAELIVAGKKYVEKRGAWHEGIL